MSSQDGGMRVSQNADAQRPARIPGDAGSDAARASVAADAGTRGVPAGADASQRDATADARAGAGPCERSEIPAEHRATIDLTWDEMTGGFEGKTGARPSRASILTFRNTILDQLIANDGKIQYCVRWDSSAVASTDLRDAIEPMLQRNLNEWFSKLVGYDCFPYTQVEVTVTGWAVRSRDRLQWSDDSVPVYVNDIRENAPQCAEACGRFFHQQPGYGYPDCPGGKAAHYDMSLWLTDGFRGGVGGDWGQRVATDYVSSNVEDERLHIILHEMGHGFGFPDYYNWAEWAPNVPPPNSVMVAGRATTVTAWDEWMLRHTWSALKSRWP